MLQESVQQLGDFGYVQTAGWFTALLAEAQLLTGAVDRARELAERGLKLTTDANYRYGLAWARRALGRIALAGGNLPESEACFTEALHAFEAIHARFEVGRTHLHLAVVARARGNPDVAAAHLKEAEALFTVLRVPKYVERTARLREEFELPPA